MKLHLGCGLNVVAGWENIDKSPNALLGPRSRRILERLRVLTPSQAKADFPRGVVRTDVRKGLAYPDSSVEYIYSSHLIEHLARWRAADLLAECYRVLSPGGVARFATPDLAVWINDYVDGYTAHYSTPADEFMHRLHTAREPRAPLVQRTIHKWAHAPHQWLYDEASLRALMAVAGFTEIVFCTYRKGRVPELDKLEHRPDSLFVEGAKTSD